MIIHTGIILQGLVLGASYRPVSKPSDGGPVAEAKNERLFIQTVRPSPHEWKVLFVSDFQRTRDDRNFNPA